MPILNMSLSYAAADKHNNDPCNNPCYLSAQVCTDVCEQNQIICLFVVNNPYHNPCASLRFFHARSCR